MDAEKAARVRIGGIVFVLLGILTGVEYWIAVSFTGILLALAVIAVAKVGLIAYYFMHIAQLRYREGGH